ncbi:MAG: hypothetical protein RBS13_01100, partial [Bacteroidales bacterium]|nr:hypothetical protein [Bacteroidales bacterium]
FKAPLLLINKKQLFHILLFSENESFKLCIRQASLFSIFHFSLSSYIFFLIHRLVATASHAHENAVPVFFIGAWGLVERSPHAR